MKTYLVKTKLSENKKYYLGKVVELGIFSSSPSLLNLADKMKKNVILYLVSKGDQDIVSDIKIKLI